ncbi:hypothetical protein, partial [Vibrio vulnificus]|uniref:hypothetical protein n=2 Tax=Vibrio vulnificus TaxID=672 RepID=UPI0013EE6978
IRLLENEGFQVKYFNNNIVRYDGAINYNDSNEIKSKRKNQIKKVIKLFNIDKVDFFLKRLERKEITSTLSEVEKVVLKKELLAYDADYLIFFWGTTFRKEIEFIKTLNLKAKKVIILNTYPVRTKFNCWNENKFIQEDREYFSFFDKFIFPSSAMYELFCDSTYINNKSALVNPDFVVCENILQNKNVSVTSTKRLVFLGNTDFSLRNIDDIRNVILNAAHNGIKVYIQESYDAIKLSRCYDNIITFKPFNFESILNGDLIKYISQFDGVLFSYNDVSKIRYNSSITTRLLLAEGCGVPVYIFGKRPDFLDDELIHGVFKCVNNVYELLSELANMNDNVDKFVTGMTALERAKKFIGFLKD